MLGFHPFLDVAVSSISGWLLVEFYLVVSVKIVSEVLKKSHLFLKFSFCRVFTHLVRSDRVSFVSSFLFNIFKILTIFVNDDLSWVIEINTSWTIWKKISQSVFSRVIDPLFDMNFRMNDSFVWNINIFTFFVGTGFSFIWNVFVAWLLSIFGWSSKISATWTKIIRFAKFLSCRFKIEVFLRLFFSNSFKITVACLLSQLITGVGSWRFCELISEVFGRRTGQSASWNGLRDGIAHERIVKDIFESGSFWWIKDQYFCD